MDDKDPKWEFSCPQFVDFSLNPNEYNDNADVWFDKTTTGELSMTFNESTMRGDKKSKDVSKQSIPTTVGPLLPTTMQSPVMGPVVKRLRLSTTGKKSPSLRRSNRRSSSHHILRNRFSFRLRGAQHDKTIVSSVKKPREVKKPVEVNKEVDFVASLRRYDGPKTTDTKCMGHVTVPVPFKLSGNEMKAAVPKFRSIAEQVAAFHSQTPDRFRRTKKVDGTAGEVSVSLPVVTRKPAQSPRLLTRLRSRPAIVVSNDERERLEVEEMKKFQFHANPINPLIMDKPDDLPKVEAKAATVFHPFNLRSMSRGASTITSHCEETVPTFSARPIPKGLFDNPKIAAVMKRNVTAAQSPAFSLKNRANHWQDIETYRSEREIRESARAKRVAAPVFSEPFFPKLEHRKTVVEPFNFEERDMDRKEKKEEKMKQILQHEKEMREFHAQPLPTPVVTGLPPKQPIPGTKLEPFHLSADDRGKLKHTKWLEQMEHDLQEQRAKLQFKAKPCRAIYESPFLPQPVLRPLTDKSNFELETEKRAKERKVFEDLLKEKEARNQEIQREREEFRLEEERIEVEKMRKNAVHRAQPVRHYKEVNFEGSNIPLTKPISPNFISKKRKRQI